MGVTKFLTIFVVVFFYLSVIQINKGVEGFHKIYSHLQSVSAISVSDRHRTSYHFQPHRNWINGL
ncbi:putative beta-fructofuranosidase [Lupinus albus]|uniref:Putative beta-fructofuranosidase n=1 Tax=Lupinus albus TaxID=3870 RepID=A0A6A4R6S9_LUPAL|nr:putative beta-fructofuranosidase [Lupinus albus]